MKNLLIAVCLLASVCAVGQVFPAPPPYPASAGLCQVSDSNHNWTAGACSGATATNFSALVADSANISTGTFQIGNGTTLQYTGTGVIAANKILTQVMTALYGNSGKLIQATGTFTSGNLTATDASGNLVDAGAAISSYVPTSRTVAGKALSSNVTIATGDLSDVSTAATLAGQILIWNASTGKYVPARITAGTNVTVTNADGSITIASTGGGGTTTNALTINNSGSGDVSGSTFNGSAAKTISYNSIGAQQALTLTTTGTSGAATLVAGTLNIPNYAAGGGISNSAPNLHLMESDGTNAIDSGIVRSTNDYNFPGAVNAASSISSAGDGTHAGSFGLVGNTTAPVPDANTAGLAGPSSTTFTAYRLQLPTSGPGAAGLVGVGALSSAISAVSFYTLSGTGTVIPTTNSPTFTTPNIGAATATSVNGTTIPSSAILTQTIGSGTTIALGTSAIASGACGTAATGTITGAATTDVVTWSPNADWSSITGYTPATTGSLILYVWVSSANTVSAKQCNPTASSITPSAATINVRIGR